MTKIAIVNTSSLARYSDLLNKLESIAEVDFITVDNGINAVALGSQLSEYEHIILASTPNFTSEVIENCKNLKHISRQGIGYDNVDIKFAKNQGIKVSNIPSYVEKDDVAEFALALLLMVSKNIKTAYKAIQNGEWSIGRERFLGQRLRGKTIGIIGFGNIGKSFSQKVKGAFDAKIIVYDPHLTENQITEFDGKKVTLETLLKKSDVVSLHLPSNSETYHIINKSKLDLMKRTSILINTSRGDLVDEIAVSEAVENNVIHSYATDVLEKEPIEEDNPLLDVENILITPHISVYNHECNYDMCSVMVDNVFQVHYGLELENWINK